MNLDPLEHAMLEQCYRFGLGRAELAPLIPQLRHASDAAELLDGLTEKGYLGIGPLYGNERYYFLSAQADETFELDKPDIGPLKEPEKIKRFAMLRLALTFHQPPRPLTPSDFRQYLGHLYHARPNRPALRRQEPRFRNYYLTAERRLGALRVDLPEGDTRLAGRYDRILGRTRRQIAKHKSLPPYAELIRQGAFEITIVTPFLPKAKRLQSDLANVSTDVPIHIRAIAELREFIAPTKANGRH